MDATHYEIYVKPTDGPCSVQERDSQGRFAWFDKDYAKTYAGIAKAMASQWG